MDKYNKFYEEYSKIERNDLYGALIFSKEKYDQIVAFFLGNSRCHDKLTCENKF